MQEVPTSDKDFGLFFERVVPCVISRRFWCKKLDYLTNNSNETGATKSKHQLSENKMYKK